MLENFSSSQTVRKTVVATKAGVVAAQHRRAAENVSEGESFSLGGALPRG